MEGEHSPGDAHQRLQTGRRDSLGVDDRRVAGGTSEQSQRQKPQPDADGDRADPGGDIEQGEPVSHAPAAADPTFHLQQITQREEVHQRDDGDHSQQDCQTDQPEQRAHDPGDGAQRMPPGHREGGQATVAIDNIQDPRLRQVGRIDFGSDEFLDRHRIGEPGQIPGRCRLSLTDCDGRSGIGHRDLRKVQIGCRLNASPV